jgi:hypothetical protein
MFGWRLLAKSTLLTILPPIFRASSRAFDFTLPTRKHYTAATDYAEVPSKHIRTVPSFVDIGLGHMTPSPAGTPEAQSPIGPGAKLGQGSSSSLEVVAAGVRSRKKSHDSLSSNGERSPSDAGRGKGKRKGSDHYDAEGKCEMSRFESSKLICFA